jgi:hypothetical protein
MEPEGASIAAAHENAGVRRSGFVIAVLVASLTTITFALAMTALPNKVPYPFTTPVIEEQWPGDYLWMYPAMVLMLLFVALVAAVHVWAPPATKRFSLVGLCLAVVAAAVLLIDYYVQTRVLQVSLEKGQLDGWAMLTQYNPDGVFIALEELGYLLMSFVFLCLGSAFGAKNGTERALRWLLRGSFALTVLALVSVSAAKGIDRGDTFEIIVISVVWLTLIAAASLMAVVFRRDGLAQDPAM